jgi:hypothetical protein
MTMAPATTAPRVAGWVAAGPDAVTVRIDIALDDGEQLTDAHVQAAQAEFARLLSVPPAQPDREE